MQIDWSVYGLKCECGLTFYVGFTNDVKRRMREHAKSYGVKPSFSILETGKDAEVGLAAELRWIDRLTSNGICLTNRVVSANGGARVHSATTRARISRIVKGMPKPKGFGARLSSASKGKPRNWTKDGEARLAVSRLKGEHDLWDRLTEEQRAEFVARGKAQWEHIPAEERSRIATERNKAAWAARTPEQRAAIAKAISDAQKNRFQNGGKKPNVTPEQRVEAGRKSSATKKAYWAAQTPEDRTQHAKRLNDIDPAKKSEAMRRAWATRRSRQSLA